MGEGVTWENTRQLSSPTVNHYYYYSGQQQFLIGNRLSTVLSPVKAKLSQTSTYIFGKQIKVFTYLFASPLCVSKLPLVDRIATV